ncbi:MAG TPA: alpha/beta fold hydrolase [Gaiellaceae bacterium]|nr:alpha/beta fold hydrolase [Gaiellaceae bacterium]
MRKLVPLYFGPRDGLFGVLNPADGITGRGVLICSPLGYENVIYHRQLAILARRIAAKGTPTLRFDWPGCGDSAGDDLDPGLIPRSLDSVQTAVETLRDRTGVEHVDIVGLRIGATLAASIVGQTEHAGSLALWDPFRTGTAYLRNLRAFERLGRKARTWTKDDSYESAAGFRLSRETVAALESLDLLQCDFGSPRRVFLGYRDGLASTAVAEHLIGQGHDVTTAELEGLREVALGWAERPVPVSSFEAIEDWLELPDLAAGEDFPALTGGPERFTGVQLANGVHEDPVLLSDGNPMLGFVSLPPAESPKRSWVLFVPNRYARRIGPNGLYRRWARSWAEAGLPSFRVDVNGTGDAGGPDGETDWDMYQPNCVDDVVRALDFLRNEFDGDRAAIIGLCSGGYLGFHAALRDEMVKDVFLLNPQMLLWTDVETSVTMAAKLRGRLVRPRSWLRLLRNPGSSRFVLPVVRRVLVADLRWRLKLRKGRTADPGRSAPIDQWIRESIRTLGERGCRLHFVFSEDDAGIGYLTRYLGTEMQGLADQPNVTFHVIEGADHTFTSFDRQIALHDLIAGTLASSGYGLSTELRPLVTTNS